MKAIAGGTDYISSLTQIEILFNKITTLQPLSRVYNLIELTLIGTQTSTLAGVECVGHSLEILNVTMCQLREIEPCFNKLVQLKHINLGENQIREIGANLQQCSLLERVSMYQN